jgi:hypothetical protein
MIPSIARARWRLTARPGSDSAPQAHGRRASSNDFEPVLGAIGKDAVKRVAVMCPERGAVETTTMTGDPQGHAEHLCNGRFGSDH